jgi:hypothetical protein
MPPRPTNEAPNRTSAFGPRNGRTCARANARESSGRERHGERGSGNLKAIIWTMILAAFIYVAVMTVPVLINEYEFQDTLQDIARYSSVNRKTNEQVKKAVLDEAQKEDLPIEADDIKVEGAAGNIHITVDYSVTVDLKFYQWTMNFHPAANNAALL